MRKSTLLKLMGTCAAVMFSFGVMAQTGTAIPGQGVPVAYTSGGTTYVVVGDDIPLYASPDPVYHSSWNYATGTWTLTPGFVWNWSRTGGAADTGTGTLTFSQTGVNDNYVEISVDAAGQYEIQVTEEAPLALGGCEGNPTTLIIQAVATPAITLAGGGTTPNYCEGDPAIPTTVNTTISGGWQNYRVVWNLEIATLGAGLAKDFYYDDENGTNPTAGSKYAVTYTTGSPASVAASGVYNIMTVGSFEVIGNKPTVYTYNVVSINDQALRFGDFITLDGVATDPAAFRYNAVTGSGSYIIQVNPAPVTGPIYHIPATWAN